MEEHSAERLAAIVESSFDAIISKDLSGTIVSWNRAAERMFGYAENEAIGKPIYLIIPDDKRDEEADILRRLKLGERIEPFQTTRRHRDGRIVPISITISPIKSRAGKLIGASSIARDISETRESDRRLRLLMRERLLVDDLGGHRRFDRFLHGAIEPGDEENVGKGPDIVYAHCKGECGQDRGERTQRVADHRYVPLAVAIRQDTDRIGGHDLDDVAPDVEKAGDLGGPDDAH
ncbi:hypothetical protein RPHASCH2410_PD04595 (plasmid) [Rhizobium phaseoli Ch24-10]|nr:hypothetical protein RPHASCH2410_PD04595 [Rhizobium phaseoli Ch24-10]